MFIKKLLGFGQSPTPIANPGSIPSIFQINNSSITNLCQQTLKNMSSTLRVEERQLAFEKLAESFLNQLTNTPSISWRQFGLMHGGSLIKYTSFEGGNTNNSLDAWEQLFTFWKNGTCILKESPLSLTLLEEIIELLRDFKKLRQSLPTLRLTPFTDEEVKTEANNVLQNLQNILSKKKSCYFELGYRQTLSSDGHTMACKFLKDNDEIVVYIFNQGDGVNLHPPLNYTSTQEKVSYAYFPIRIRKDVFFSEAGGMAFCHLLRYRCDPLEPGHYDYTAEDIYNIFLVLGVVDPVLDYANDAIAVGIQKSGDCPEKEVKNLVRDFLIHKEFSREQIHTVFFHLNLLSIFSAYHSFIKSPCEDHRILLKAAAEELGISVRSKKNLHQDTFFALTAAISFIIKKTKSPLPIVFERKLDSKTSIKVEKFPDTFPKLDLSELNKPILEEVTNVATEQTYQLRIPHFIPLEFTQTLRYWIESISLIPTQFKFSYFYNCIETLPTPKIGNDEWDLIPEADISLTIDLLKEFLIVLIKKNCLFSLSSKIEFNQLFITINTLYCIVDKLARRCPETKLQGFSSPFLPHLFNFYPTTFLFLFISRENLRYKELSEYFSEQQKKEGPIIFPIDRELSVENFVWKSMHTNDISQGISHINYLKQFLPTNSLFNKYSEIYKCYVDLWMRSPNQIVHSLYYFAFVSFAIFSKSDSETSELSESLYFEKGVDEHGRAALTIHVNNKNLWKNNPHKLLKKKSAIHLKDFYCSHLSNDLFPLHHQFRSYSTNDAVCVRLSEKNEDALGYSEATFRDLLRITRNDNLKVIQALHWMASNPAQIGNIKIQGVLEHCFFAPGLLIKCLSEEPNIITEIRKTVFNGIAYFRSNPNHYSSIIFLVSLGIRFEEFYSLLYKNNLDVILTQFNEIIELLPSKNLKDEQKQELIFFKSYIRIRQSTTSSEKAIEQLIDIFNDSKKPSKYELKWFNLAWNNNCEKTLYQIASLLEQKEFRNDVCFGMAKYFLKEKHVSSLKGKAWVGEFPIYHCEDIVINFLEKTVVSKKRGLLQTVKIPFGPIEFSTLYSIHGPEFWKKNNTLESEDGKFKVHFRKEEMVYERKITFRNREIWTRIHQFSTQIVDPQQLNFLTYPEIIPFVHCIPYEGEKDCPDIITLDGRTDKPYLCIDYSKEGAKITRLDENGNSLPIKLANVSEIQEDDHPLYDYALRFSPPQYILCFINTDTKEVVELNFYRLGLKFKKQGSHLESENYPGFRILPHHRLKSLINFEGAMVLENNEGRLKVIIPAKTLQKVQSGLSWKIVLSDSSILLKKNEFVFENVFVFEIDPFTENLLSTNLFDDLYLIYLFKIKGDYSNAFIYLKRLHKTSFFDQELSLINAMTQIEDFSPESLAFNMKLLFALFENKNLLIEDQFTKNNDNYKYSEIIKWGVRTYISYLKELSSIDESSSIPKELRLKKEQEKIILDSLERILIWKKEKLPQILSNRYLLLKSVDNKMTFHIEPFTFSPSPFYLNKVQKPSKINIDKLDPNKKYIPFGERRVRRSRSGEDFTLHETSIRIKREAVGAHFVSLYEWARSSSQNYPCSFDLHLLTLFKSFKRQGMFDTEFMLLQILFYVRHFPHKFVSLSLANKADKEVIETFNLIIETVKKLELDEDFARFEKDFLNQSLVFEYKKNIEISQNIQTENFAFPHQSSVQEKSFSPSAPFRKYAEKLYKVDQEISLYPPRFPANYQSDKSSLEQSLTEKIEGGYPAVSVKKRTIRSFQNKNLLLIKENLIKEKNGRYNFLKEERMVILSMLNELKEKPQINEIEVLNEIRYLLDCDTRQIIPILPETIMKEVVLNNDPSFLLKHRPFLKPEVALLAIEKTKAYYHLLVQFLLIEDSLKLVEKIEKNPSISQHQKDLFALLNYEFLYDPLEYPEISYVKVTTGKLPKEKQAKIYLWVCEGIAKHENRLFQLPAGEGKTSYMIPLLILRAKREKLMPVVFSTQAIYSVDKENLTRNLSFLEEKLALLEVGLHMKLSASDWRFIYQQIKSCRDEKREFMITPSIYYSIHLAFRYAALKEKEIEKVKWLGLICNFLTTHCFALVDESHRNFDSLTRSIYGVGSQTEIPKEELLLFLRLMRPLTGVVNILDENGKSLSTLAKLSTNHLSAATSEEISTIQKQLALFISQDSELGIPKDNRSEFVAYWTNKLSKQPKLLIEWGKNSDPSLKLKADLISLVGYFILNLLPELLKQRTVRDHDVSVYPEEEFEVPCNNKTKSAAHYDDPYRTLIYSIKGTYHRGLTDSQIRKMLQKMIEIDRREQNTIDEETSISKQFASWIQDSSLDKLHIRDICLSDSIQFKQLSNHLKRHTNAIEYYLEKNILPQISLLEEQLVCTPAHIMEGFALSVLFSATPYLPIAYPKALKASKFDSEFEAEVISQYCHQKNQTYLFLPTSKPSLLFKWLKKEHSEQFSQINILIDAGGYFSDHSNEKVAKHWLENSDLEAVIYFKEEKALKVDQNEKIMLLLKDRKVEIEGSDLLPTLEKLKLNWSNLKIGTYYDVAHTESADIPQKETAKSILFGGENLTSSRLIQAIERSRGFINPEKNHTIIWAFNPDLAKKISSKEGLLNGASIYAWSVKNESEEMRKRIILRAFQEIAFTIEQPIIKKINSFAGKGKEQIALFEMFKKGFLELRDHDPYKEFAEHESFNNSEKILWSYAHYIYKKFCFNENLEANFELMESIEQIIQEVTRVVPTLTTQWSQDISKEVQQHTRLKKETEQIQYCPRPYDPLSAEGIYGKLDIDDPKYPLYLFNNAKNIFKTQGITDNLYFEQNQIRTAILNEESMETNYLKPIDFFLIINYNGKTIAQAIVNEIISTYIETLSKDIKTEKIKHTAFIVTSEGILYRRGKGSLKPSDDLINNILNSEWMKDLVIDAALLKGQIRYPERLRERLKTWTDFEEFWQRVIKSLPNPELANHILMTKLLKNKT